MHSTTLFQSRHHGLHFGAKPDRDSRRWRLGLPGQWRLCVRPHPRCRFSISAICAESRRPGSVLNRSPRVFARPPPEKNVGEFAARHAHGNGRFRSLVSAYGGKHPGQPPEKNDHLFRWARAGQQSGMRDITAGSRRGHRPSANPPTGFCRHTHGPAPAARRPQPAGDATLPTYPSCDTCGRAGRSAAGLRDSRTPRQDHGIGGAENSRRRVGIRTVLYG